MQVINVGVHHSPKFIDGAGAGRSSLRFLARRKRLTQSLSEAQY